MFHTIDFQGLSKMLSQDDQNGDGKHFLEPIPVWFWQ